MLGPDAPALGHRTVEPRATGLPMPRHLGNAIGHPMPGLDSPGLSHRIASCLELRSTVSASHFALRPAREIFLLTGFYFDGAPVYFEASSANGRLPFAI